MAIPQNKSQSYIEYPPDSALVSSDTRTMQKVEYEIAEVSEQIKKTEAIDIDTDQGSTTDTVVSTSSSN
jgi:hypothetical protein